MIANPTERVLFLAALRLVIEFTRFPFIFTKSVTRDAKIRFLKISF